MKPRFQLHTTLAAFAITLTAPALHAQSAANGSWVGAGGQNFPEAIWGGVANWVSSQVVTGTGATATFGNSFTNGHACIVNTARVVGNIVFNDPAAANDFILRTHTSDLILTLDVASGLPSISVNQADRTLVIQPRVAGNDGLAKNGPGRLVLGNPGSTLTGPINLNAGVLQFGGGSFTFNRGSKLTGPETVTYDLGSNGRIGNGLHQGAVTIAEGAELRYIGSLDTVISGSVTGAGLITKEGSGTLSLAGTNSFSGSVVAKGGSLIAGSPGSILEFNVPGKVSFDGGTIGVRMGGPDWTPADIDTLLTNATRNAGALGIDTSNGDLTQWTPFSTTYLGATLGLTKLGTNTLTLDVPNDYTGDTTVSAGTLALGGTGTLGDGTGDLLLNGGTLDLGGKSVTVGTLAVTAAGPGGTLANGGLTATAYGASNATGNAILSANLLANGTAGFTKSGAGTVTLGGNNTYSGDTSVTAGTLLIGNTGSSVSNITVADGAGFGVLVSANNGQGVGTGTLTLGANTPLTVDFASASPSTTVAPLRLADYTPSADTAVRILADSFGILAPGQSYPLLTWTGAGPADVSAFTSLALAHRVNGNLSITGGNTLSLNMTYNAPGPVSWNTGDGSWDTLALNWLDSTPAATAYIDLLDEVILGDALGATGNPVITVPAKVSPVSVTMNSSARDYSLTGEAGEIGGTATLTLAATNTRTLNVGTFLNSYTGDTVINGGTLRLLDFDVIPHGAAKGNVVLNAPGVFDMNGLLENVNGLSGDGTVDNVTSSDTPTLIVGNNNASSTFSGVIKNTGGAIALTKVGTGRLILTSQNTYSGDTTVNGGVLQVGEGGTNGSIGAGPIALTSGTLEFRRSDDFEIDDALAGGGGFTQGGTGTITLSGDNSYTGATTVNGGMLRLTGDRTTNSGAINVTSGSVMEIANGTFSLGAANFSVGNTSGVSTLNQTGGNLTFSGGNQLLVGNVAGDGVYNLSAGTFTTVNVANRGVMLGVNTGRSGTFNLSGTGELLMGATSVLHVGRGENSAASATKGFFNQTGGTASAGDLRIGGSTVGAVNNAGTTGELNLTGGTFTAASFTQLSGGNNSASSIHIGGTADVTLPAFPTGRGIDATATLTFDGGVLKPAAPSPTYISGLTAAFIMDGGATIDTTLGDATIAQPLLAHPESAGGGLTKAGIGVLTLTGINTYSGDTTVTAGTLSLAEPNPNNQASTVAIAATDAKLQLTFVGMDSVAKLVTGTTERPIGQYGHTDSGATNGGLGVGALDAFFEPGTGILNVTGEVVGGDTFADWIATYPGVGAFTGFNDDADGDGVPNGVENFFGTHPAEFSAGLTVGEVNGGTFTFTHPQSGTPASDVQAAYRWSKDLATFHASGASDGDGTTVTFTTQPNTPAAGTTTVTATVTGTQVTRLFVDVRATQTE
jgi:fibronectin-binding autotransporter adhesin